MVRKLKMDDLEAVMTIWLETNITAHDFIEKNYWKKNYDPVKGMLPNATVFVFEDNHTIQGFIGLIENDIAGIFIRSHSQSKGIGKALLDCVKENCSELSLQVYKKNTRAIQFYERENFIVLKEQTDENTDETEFVMKWTKKASCGI